MSSFFWSGVPLDRWQCGAKTRHLCAIGSCVPNYGRHYDLMTSISNLEPRAAEADGSGHAAGHIRPTIPSHLHPLSFITRLKWRLDNEPPRQKSQRTRERLKLACAEILNEKGFHELKAADVSAVAGLAEGSFYIYFADKRDIARTVLSEFQDMFFNVLLNSRGSPGGSDFESMRQANYVWIACARANAGLFRCMYQFSDEDSQFSREFQRDNMRWNLRTMRVTMRKGALPALKEPEVMLLVYLLAGMMDDLARKLIVYPDREMIEQLRYAAADDETIADVATLIWLRLLRPQELPPAHLVGSVATIAEALFPIP